MTCSNDNMTNEIESGNPAALLLEATKCYGPNRVLGPVSAVFRPGTVTGIRGENGAGKSTLISVLAGVLKPDSGKCTVYTDVCFVPQEIALYPALSCRDNLLFWAGVYGLKGKNKRQAVDRVLEQVGLTEKAAARLETCSGGMKRRINLAAALLKPCGLLLLDEPTAGCDSHSVEIILSLIQREAERDTAVVLVSHDEEDLLKVCDRILTLSSGVITGEEYPQRGI